MALAFRFFSETRASKIGDDPHTAQEAVVRRGKKFLTLHPVGVGKNRRSGLIRRCMLEMLFRDRILGRAADEIPRLYLQCPFAGNSILVVFGLSLVFISSAQHVHACLLLVVWFSFAMAREADREELEAPCFGQDFA